MAPIAIRPLRDVALVSRGKAQAEHAGSAVGTPFLGAREIGAGDASLLPLIAVNESLGWETLRVGDVVVALRSNIGHSMLVTSRLEGVVVGSDCAVIRPRINDVTGHWIYAWTHTSSFLGQADRHTSFGGFAPSLDHHAVYRFTIPVAPFNTSKRILSDVELLVDEFETAMAKVDQLRSQLTELRRHEADLLLNGVDEV